MPTAADAWARSWARAAGIGLLAIFVLPVPNQSLLVPDRWRFFWEMDLESGWHSVVLVPLLLGLLAVVVPPHLRGRRLGAFLALSGGWAMAAVLLPGGTASFGSRPAFLPYTRGWALLPLLIATGALAGENHARRVPPPSPGLRFAPAGLGLLILLALALPRSIAGRPPISVLRPSRLLDPAVTPYSLTVAALGVYALLGVAGTAFPVASRGPTTWFARFAAIGVFLGLGRLETLSAAEPLPALACAVQNGVGFYALVALLGSGVAVLLAPPAAEH